MFFGGGGAFGKLFPATGLHNSEAISSNRCILQVVEERSST